MIGGKFSELIQLFAWNAFNFIAFKEISKNLWTIKYEVSFFQALTPNPATNQSNFLESDDPDDAEMLEGGEGLTSQAEEEEKRKKKNGTTFMVLFENRDFKTSLSVPL